MLQTYKDAIQQVIRIALYAGAGALVTAGILDKNTAMQLAAALLTLANGLWTIRWNRKQVVTISGLEKAAKNRLIPVSGATVVELKAAKGSE
jgi:glutaminase